MIGPDGQVAILDFGIGSLLAENEGESLVDTMSTANTLTSGLDCASPESIMEPTNRTPAGDQYSLGCVLYFCLTGRYPFPEGSAVEKMVAHQIKQPTPIQELVAGGPAELVSVVERLMQKKPEDRLGGADEVAEKLLPLSGGWLIPAAEPPKPVEPPKPAVRVPGRASPLHRAAIGRRRRDWRRCRRPRGRRLLNPKAACRPSTRRQPRGGRPQFFRRLPMLPPSWRTRSERRIRQWTANS